MSRLWRIVLRGVIVLLTLLIAASVATILVFRSDWFRDKLRERIVAEIENSTGGRVELGGVHLNWTGLTAQVDKLVLHGKEAAGEPPLLQSNSVVVGLRIISALERKVDLA